MKNDDCRFRQLRGGKRLKKQILYFLLDLNLT